MKKNEFYALDEGERMNRVLTGVAYYANVHSPNLSSMRKFKAQPLFVVSLGLADADEVAKAKSYGLTINDPTDIIPYPWVKIQRKVKDADITRPIEEILAVSDKVKPSVIDGKQTPIPKTILVGNESLVKVKFGTYWYENGAGGVGTVMFKVQVLKLVPFVAKSNDPTLDMDEDGFSVDDFLSTGSTGADTTDALEDVLSSPTKKVAKGKGGTSSSIFDD